jgi:hypothetical protein
MPCGWSQDMRYHSGFPVTSLERLNEGVILGLSCTDKNKDNTICDSQTWLSITLIESSVSNQRELVDIELTH